MDYDDPSLLFRYKYREATADNLKIITEGTLKFSSPLEFNDPFDSEPAYQPDSVANFAKYNPGLVKKLRRQERLTPSEYFRKKPKYQRNVNEVLQSGQWKNGIYSTVGVLCLSRTPCSMLMWSHYAANHTGFVVEFKVDASSYPDVANFAPFPVAYSEKRPVLPWGCPKKNSVDAYFLTKAIDWAYEEEERVIDAKRGPGIYPYERKRLLSSVIAGVRVSAEHYLALQEAVDSASEEIGRKINLYRAALSPDSYRIYIPDHPNPMLSAPSLE